MSGGANDTRWSRIEEGDFEYFFGRYWKPVHRFLADRLPASADSEAITQEMFVAFLERDFLGRASARRGSFRSLLFHAVRQFLIDQYRAAGAAKRGADRQVPFEFGEKAAAGGPSPEEAFDREWFQSLLNRARKNVKAAYVERGRTDLYQAFHLFLFGDGSGAPWPQDRIAARLGLTLDQVKNAVRRLKVAYGNAIRDIVAESTDGEEAYAAELASLSRFLDGGEFHGLAADTVFVDPDPDRA